MRICICPGTFDPITNGHLDIITRAAQLFDKVIVAVAEDNYKENLFTAAERVDLVKACVADLESVEVKPFSGLLMDFCRKEGACAVVRGLRAVSDFEYEMQQALMNKALNPEVETVFLMTGQKYSFISSSIIKNVAVLGGSVTGLVPSIVEAAMLEKYKTKALNG